MKNLINKVALIQVKYMPPTNTRGSYVKLTSYDVKHRNNNKPKSINIAYNYEFNSSADIAINALEIAGFTLLGLNTSHNEHDVIFCKWEWDLMAKFFKVKSEV